MRGERRRTAAVGPPPTFELLVILGLDRLDDRRPAFFGRGVLTGESEEGVHVVEVEHGVERDEILAVPADHVLFGWDRLGECPQYSDVSGHTRTVESNSSGETCVCV